MSEYPRMIYSEDGKTHILQSEDSQKPEGNWSDTPSEVHFSTFSEHHTTRVPVNDPSRPKQQDDEEALTARIMQRLADQGLLRRPPGRPPGSASSSNGD